MADGGVPRGTSISTENMDVSPSFSSLEEDNRVNKKNDKFGRGNKNGNSGAYIWTKTQSPFRVFVESTVGNIKRLHPLQYQGNYGHV